MELGFRNGKVAGMRRRFAGRKVGQKKKERILRRKWSERVEEDKRKREKEGTDFP